MFRVESAEKVRRRLGEQWGVVTRSQLLEAGVSASSIKRRLASGDLRRLHPAVYFVGHGEPCLRARAFAALAASEKPAALSHRTSAEIHELLDPRPGPIHITVVGRTNQKLSGVRIHTTKHLPPSQVTKDRILRRTTTARTIADLAATTNDATVQRALNHGTFLGIVELDVVRAQLPTMRRGKTRLVRAIANATRARSGLEDRFYSLVKAAELPPPVGNFRIGPYVVDFYWPDLGLVVEIDGPGHENDPAQAHDARKDAYLKGLGLQVERVPRRRLDHHPYLVVAELSAAIARRASGL
jgi:very-short-patch-repair endonuclease